VKRAAVLLALAWSACAGQRAAQEEAAHQAQALAAPTVSGAVLRCAASDEVVELGGGRVQVVELWATWCQPCIRALPLWDELGRTTGTEILAVSIDDEREAPVAFARKHGIGLPILWDPFARTLSRSVELPGVVPTTLVVGCDGTVRHVHRGFDDGKVVAAVAEQVRALRAESTCTGAPALAPCAP